MNNNEEITELTKQLAIKIADCKEAFIMEEMKPYYDYKDGKIEFNQKVKLRLAEIKDYKLKFASKLDACIDSIIFDIDNFSTCDEREKEWLRATIVTKLSKLIIINNQEM